MKTTHTIHVKDSVEMDSIPSNSINLIVTSPPYPMIEMWDETFCVQDPSIKGALKKGEGVAAFELMHKRLDLVWKEVYRVLKEGSFACINIGDATRTINGDFCLYSNHSRILHYLLSLGFCALPDILWRKQTNAPNKFMGSGMLPAGAYVTLEHEYILIMRKGSKRVFDKDAEKRKRRESAIFWEERNVWFSDVWMDIKGTTQKLYNGITRARSAAFPFELAYRLVNMYSARGDTILDPFLGTGTTSAATMASGRNSIGYEIDENFSEIINAMSLQIVDFSNNYIQRRLNQHLEFVKNRIITKGPLKYTNTPYGFPVLTNQEKELVIYDLACVESIGNNIFEVSYSEETQKILSKDLLSQLNQSNSEAKLLLSPKKRSLIGKQDLKSSQKQLI